MLESSFLSRLDQTCGFVKRQRSDIWASEPDQLTYSTFIFPVKLFIYLVLEFLFLPLPGKDELSLGQCPHLP